MFVKEEKDCQNSPAGENWEKNVIEIDREKTFTEEENLLRRGEGRFFVIRRHYPGEKRLQRRLTQRRVVKSGFGGQKPVEKNMEGAGWDVYVQDRGGTELR